MAALEPALAGLGFLCEGWFWLKLRTAVVGETRATVTRHAEVGTPLEQLVLLLLV